MNEEGPALAGTGQKKEIMAKKNTGDHGIQLSVDQQDVLNELINIGFGRAASSLSMLVNQRIVLNVPQLQICPLEQIGSSLKELTNKDLINVHQVFHGKLTGHAMLLMDIQSAAVFEDLMNGGPGKTGPITPSVQEALAEVGNIVINAFLGAFGNLLKIHLAFTVPSLRVETLVHMIQSLLAGDEPKGYAMVVKIRFHLAQQDVNGYLVVVMGAKPLEALLEAIRKEGMFS